MHEEDECSNECILCSDGDSLTDGSVSRGEDEELDMDLMLKALWEFQQELRDTQRERVYLNLHEFSWMLTHKF